MSEEVKSMKLSLYLLSSILIFLLFRKDKSNIYKQECLSCGKLIEGKYLKCPHCSDEVKRKCTNCSKIIEVNWRECPFCDSPQEYSNEK